MQWLSNSNEHKTIGILGWHESQGFAILFFNKHSACFCNHWEGPHTVLWELMKHGSKLVNSVDPIPHCICWIISAKITSHQTIIELDFSDRLHSLMIKVPVCLSIYLSIDLSICLSVCLAVNLFIKMVKKFVSKMLQKNPNELSGDHSIYLSIMYLSIIYLCIGSIYYIKLKSKWVGLIKFYGIGKDY